MPSCRFKHLEGDAMDGQLLRNAGIAKADAVIVGNAHDADPKDVSLLFHVGFILTGRLNSSSVHLCTCVLVRIMSWLDMYSHESSQALTCSGQVYIMSKTPVAKSLTSRIGHGHS